MATLCLLVIGLQFAGCGWISRKLDREYYLVEPSLVSLGEGRSPCAAKEETDAQGTVIARPSAASADLTASDALVLIYSDCIKKMLRSRMNLARVARLTSSSFAVLTAAAAAALGAVATAPLTAITALAAASAVTPEFMRIFGADERAKAYDEGVHMIEEAEGQYLVNLATTQESTKIPLVLTTHGAQLYVQVAASLKIVENLLVAQLPKVEDIERAQGRVARLGEIRVVPEMLAITNASGTARLVVIGGGVVTNAVSTNTSIVTIENGEAVRQGAREVLLKGGAPGSATVIITNETGAQKPVTVEVGLGPVALTEGTDVMQVKPDASVKYTAVARNLSPTVAAPLVMFEVFVEGANAPPTVSSAKVSCGPIPVASGHLLKCSVALPPNETAPADFTVKAPKNAKPGTTINFSSQVWQGQSKPSSLPPRSKFSVYIVE